MATYQDRFPNNSPGAYYVDDQCIDCELCQERAPEVFHRDHEMAHSFVFRQPETDEEREACEDALDSCPVDAIGDDGPHGDMTRKNPCQLPGIVQQ
ncbi:MAG: ferredoxin [Verrucomicrobiales bacterium]|nr:ferredoxin [Verrucomicrobiales bacterium]